jgi:hypothetical protein
MIATMVLPSSGNDAKEAWSRASLTSPAVPTEHLTKWIQKCGNLDTQLKKWKSPFFCFKGDNYTLMAIDEAYISSHKEEFEIKLDNKLIPRFRNEKLNSCVLIYPTLKQLALKSQDALKHTTLKIIHRRYGKIVFKEPVDIRNLVIDDVFKFNERGIEINSENTVLSKKRVEIHIFNTYPQSITPEGLNEYKQELIEYSTTMKGAFIAYENGTYIFEVNLA